jgi:hypothetical protein
VTLPEHHLRAIARAVQRAGGDLEDAEDLADAWERMECTWGPRVDRTRYEAATARCVCGVFVEVGPSGRCKRCQGWPR